jgi:hypothetical protein
MRRTPAHDNDPGLYNNAEKMDEVDDDRVFDADGNQVGTILSTGVR